MSEAGMNDASSRIRQSYDSLRGCLERLAQANDPSALLDLLKVASLRIFEGLQAEIDFALNSGQHEDLEEVRSKIEQIAFIARLETHESPTGASIRST